MNTKQERISLLIGSLTHAALSDTKVSNSTRKGLFDHLDPICVDYSSFFEPGSLSTLAL